MAVETPELDKAHLVMDESQSIGHFLDWLEGEGIHLCTLDEDGYGDLEYVPRSESFEQLLARYYKLDLSKMDSEKMAILAEFRREQEIADTVKLRKELSS